MCKQNSSASNIQNNVKSYGKWVIFFKRLLESLKPILFSGRTIKIRKMEPPESVYNFTLMLCLNCPNVFWDDHTYFQIWRRPCSGKIETCPQKRWNCKCSLFQVTSLLKRYFRVNKLIYQHMQRTHRSILMSFWTVKFSTESDLDKERTIVLKWQLYPDRDTVRIF